MGVKEIGIWGMIFLWTAGLAAQTDLVALQKKEKERRKKMKASVLILTDESVANNQGKEKSVTTVGIEAAVEEGQSELSGETNQPAPVVENAELDRSYWVGLKRSHDTTLEQQKEKIKGLELQIEQKVIARASESNPVKYNQMAEEISQLEVSKGEEKKSLEEIERNWENVLTDAREKGVPSNWLSD